MRVEFKVMGRPPRKHGEKSMWARCDEAPFVASLRTEALEARLKSGYNRPFDSLVALELRVFVPKSKLESIGDLDSFITGVCDSLQPADPKVSPYLDETLQGLREEARPNYALLITNDAKVVSINAKKVAKEENEKLHYKVAIETVSEDNIEREVKGVTPL